MPVFHRNKLVFIHIPKTGGTAVEQYFHDIGDMQWGLESWLGHEKQQGRWYEYQHLSMLELQSMAGTSITGFRSFSVVRNPYEKLLSDYLWRKVVKRKNPDASLMCFGSFAEFIDAIPENIDTMWPQHIDGVGMDEANFLIHVRPQYQFVTDGDGARLVDEILKFEQLDDDLRQLLERFGLAADSIKKPQARDMQLFYDSAMLKLVNRIYAKDFELFSYYQYEDFEYS